MGSIASIRASIGEDIPGQIPDLEDINTSKRPDAKEFHGLLQNSRILMPNSVLLIVPRK